jgi:hypothetical protein
VAFSGKIICKINSSIYSNEGEKGFYIERDRERELKYL